MVTVKDVMDVYNNNPEVKAIIDAQINGHRQKYDEVKVSVDGLLLSFENVVEIVNNTDSYFVEEGNFTIVHSRMFCGHITDLATNVLGVVKLKSIKTGEREWQG